VAEEREFRPVAVFDGHRLRCGNRILGPAVVEQRNTTLFVGGSFDMVLDPMGSFLVYRRGREDVLPGALRGGAA